MLLDYVEDYEPGEYAVGYKCVTFREDFFAGHFPGEPVMPPDQGWRFLPAACTAFCLAKMTHHSRRYSPSGETTNKACPYSTISPLRGVFYAAPSEGAEPFVVPGDRVKKGQTLGIVEAMKLMNEIESDCDGVVTEICVRNYLSISSQILHIKLHNTYKIMLFRKAP